MANDDEIDWEDLGLDSETSAPSLPSVTSGSKSALNGSRRQSQVCTHCLSPFNVASFATLFLSPAGCSGIFSYSTREIC